MNKKILNRKTYKAVKKMDRNAMENFVKNIYRQAFKDGAEAGNNADFRILLVKVLKNTKGVGATIYNRAMETYKEME